VTAAWQQREVTVPGEWSGRRIKLSTAYLNSYAAVYVDIKKAGEMRYPAGEIDLTALCRPGPEAHHRHVRDGAAAEGRHAVL
jgi:beta-galactosidase